MLGRVFARGLVMAALLGWGLAAAQSWLWAIKGTPREIVERMYQEVAKALNQPDIRAVWEQQGAVAGGQPPAEFAKLVRSEVQRWNKVVREAKVKIDN